MTTGGLVLAGGAGRRMGRPKATVVLEGRTLVERAVAVLTARCDEVVVVSRPDVPLPALPVPVIHDREGLDGPMNAIATGLTALTADDVVVLACDLPAAAPVVDRLLAAPAHQAVVAGNGRAQPLCARYPRAAALDACNRLLADGNPRMSALTDALHATVLPATPEELRNVNEPADLPPPIDVDEVRVHIDARPEEVWAMVADITQVPTYSPVCVRTEWLPPSDKPAVGARFRGHNRRNGFRWSRDCEITACEPGRRFTFQTRFRGEVSTTWDYTFTPSGAGTDVVEAYKAVLLPTWIKLMRKLPGALQTSRRQAHENISESLANLKAKAERGSTLGQ